ncbi:unnamed protein product [Fusarium graminearum]|uniref:Chromosome 3, complete genome n=1 Tax=Gibberella zeae (strain ATCC MYA-4620 / CBS 123657 / FGSC 9075 / NRRL 31084 / PH-1) TaxID=229533 RepID=A0A098E5A2_GIBZE|nr:unnamed protein product [Fusarium graminearum]CZS85637.1 unnamed protein product [Fusarium graminearum]
MFLLLLYLRPTSVNQSLGDIAPRLKTIIVYPRESSNMFRVTGL